MGAIDPNVAADLVAAALDRQATDAWRRRPM
jgi:hypothetical protein